MEAPLELKRQQAREEVRCPYCHAGFEPDATVVSCGGCATVYHRDCLRDELGRCATLGCAVRPELGKHCRYEELDAPCAKQAAALISVGARSGPPLVHGRYWTWLTLGLLATFDIVAMATGNWLLALVASVLVFLALVLAQKLLDRLV